MKLVIEKWWNVRRTDDIPVWLWHPSVEPITGLMWCDWRKPVLGELWNPNLSNPANIVAWVAWQRLPQDEFWALCAQKMRDHAASWTDEREVDTMVRRWHLIDAHLLVRQEPSKSNCGDDVKGATCKMAELKIE